MSRPGGPVITAARWFARVGLPLDEAELAAADALAREHVVFGRAQVAIARSWDEASGWLRMLEAEGDAFEQAEPERERLWMLAAERLGEPALAGELDALHRALDPVLARALAEATEVHGRDAARLAGAARMAAHVAAQHEALLGHAQVDAAHPFAHAWSLFVAGRWPLGFHQGRYAVF